MSVFRITPALFRRAFFIGGCLIASVGLSAVPKGQAPPPLTQLGAADPTEGRAAIEQVRQQGIAGNYYLEFQLRVMPRRGEERLIAGRLWGTQNHIGALSRVTLTLAEGAAVPRERRFLIQNGRESAVWRWDTGGGVQQLGAASPFDPVVPNTELAAFDLQRPFIYWDDFVYQGLARFGGRPAHILIMRPPVAFKAKHPALTGVRIHLDTQFNALVQTELLGANDSVLKTISLVDLKKIGDQWIPRVFDVRDEKTRNKTRFDVTAVGLNLEFSRVIFEPAQLDDDIRPPAESQLTRLDP
jgi:hypothetical protein